MGKKLTVIYNNRFLSGSHWHVLTHKKNVFLNDGETIDEMLDKYEIGNSVVFIFDGWCEEFEY